MTMLDDNTDIEDKIVKPRLRVINGGKGPPEAPTYNWLNELTPGTTFVCRAADKYVDYELYHVVFKTLDAVLLKWELPDGKFWDRFVDSKEFSKRYPLYIVLGVQQQESENDSSGQCDPHRLPDVVCDASVQRVDQVVSEAE